MKKVLLVLSLGLIGYSCNKESAPDCLQTTGKTIRHEITVSNFDKIFVNRDIELIIKEGQEQKVVVETGKNLMPSVVVSVLDGILILTQNNTCNYFRSYDATKVYVTSPNIREIRSSTQYNITSDGVLTYPDLTLLSEDYGVEDTYTSANFYLEVDNNSLSFVFNNLSNAFVSGATDNLHVTLAAGTSRFEARQLIAQNVTFWNRSSNDIIINPQQKLSGKISGTGHVIAINKPRVVDVEVVYKGKLIFE
ncbi:DUF2807 domain-containing protein [Tamlana fucoidanivorans]|uniref:DUF2807 domain-containing protein n=1 Tax=Allotamlana fucoidanivorans TaxID=2583814 RepID=A0A5C4SPX2_9FLAO|nr:head GIN domain-containing protein [Tamlana fucoidanivorans]TNJ46190.1 DUF2807 domain-containing protein [Tamlana fucoidanivorans]